MLNTRAWMAFRSGLRSGLLSAALLAAGCGADRVAEERFRIEPLRPIEELRREALAAQPPEQPTDLLDPDLVELIQLDPTIRLEIRYATTDNFMGARMYDEARAFLQRPAAEALLRVQQGFTADGLGLLIYDGYRPWHVTKMFWDATPDDQKDFVADPATGSIHNRGAAVDLTLAALDSGATVPMPSGYDEFSERAHPDYAGGTEEQRRNRDRLRSAMEAEGFMVYPNEWWHFNFRDAERYPVLNLRFEQID